MLGLGACELLYHIKHGSHSHALALPRCLRNTFLTTPQQQQNLSERHILYSVLIQTTYNHNRVRVLGSSGGLSCRVRLGLGFRVTSRCLGLGLWVRASRLGLGLGVRASRLGLGLGV